MKKLLLIPIVLVAMSCNKVKDWKCTVQAKGVSGEWSDGSIVYFTGTKEEMQDYEEMGNYDTEFLSVKTNCE